MKYEYKARVLSVMDGDTIKVSLRLKRFRGKQVGDLGCHVFIEDGHICEHTAIRFMGVNAPEHGTPEGDASTVWLREQLAVGAVVKIKTVRDKTEKYGRYLGYVTRKGDKTTLNDQSVAAGHAFPWDGNGARPVA